MSQEELPTKPYMRPFERKLRKICGKGGLRKLDLRISPRWLLMLIVYRANKQGECFILDEHFTNLSGMPEHLQKKHLKTLIDRGLLTVTKKCKKDLMGRAFKINLDAVMVIASE
jgi:hypothetical protein